MSITKSYNKYTDTYYAYDTDYVWDEKLQKKVQKRVCIGKYDPATGEVIPTAKRGRPPKKEVTAQPDRIPDPETACFPEDFAEEAASLVESAREIRKELALLTERTENLIKKLVSLQDSIRAKDSNR